MCFGCIHLSVYLFACVHNYSKSIKWIFLIFLMLVRPDQRKTKLILGEDWDHTLDIIKVPDVQRPIFTELSMILPFCPILLQK